jgi:hypothetical protein
MSNDNKGFELLTVSEEGEFLLSGKRLWHLSNGEIGAVYEIRSPQMKSANGTRLVRVYRQSTVERLKSDDQQVICLCLIDNKGQATTSILADSYRGTGQQWLLRRDADLTAQHEDSEETIKMIKARVDRLMSLRKMLQAELELVNSENGLLRAKFAGAITRHLSTTRS